jgi:hypothetical protein
MRQRYGRFHVASSRGEAVIGELSIGKPHSTISFVSEALVLSLLTSCSVRNERKVECEVRGNTLLFNYLHPHLSAEQQ